MLADVLAAVQYGGYVSWWKVLIVLIVLIPWLRLMTWVDKDSENAHLPRSTVNAVAIVGLLIALIAALLVPNFALAMVALVLIFGVEVGTYLLIRKQKVGLGDLGDSFRAAFKSKSKKEVSAGAGEVLITAKGKPVAPPTDEDPNRAGYDALQDVLVGPMRKGADRIELNPTADGAAAVKYFVDGYGYAGRGIGRGEASNAVGFMRQAAGMDPADRRRPQKANLKLTMPAPVGKRDAEVITAGSSAGETMSVDLDIAKRYELTIGDLGLSDEQIGKLKASVERGRGITLVSAPKGQGLTATLYALIKNHDAFIYHVQTIERDPPIDLEGITQNKLAGNATVAEEVKLVSWVVSNEPDVVMVGRVDDPRTATELIKLSKAGKRVYIGMRAGNSLEAISQWRKLVGDDKAAASELDLAISGRVVRKLCAACKMAYTPDPAALRKMNMNPDKVGQLFQARTQPLRDQKGNEIPCEFCHDLRFRGRLGVYEVLTIDDEIKAAIPGGSEATKNAFRKQRQRFLQEIALARVEAGDTSIQEVLRVLRGE